MSLLHCPRCDATIPRSTAAAGSAGRCPMCYAPVGFLAPKSNNNLAGILPLLLVGGLVFGLTMSAGYIYLVRASQPVAYQPAENMESAEEFMIKQMKQPPPKEKKKAPALVGPPPIPPQLAKTVELSDARQMAGFNRSSHIRVNIRYIGPDFLLQLKSPTIYVRYGSTEMKFPVGNFAGGDFTCENALPPKYDGKVEIYFMATHDRDAGLDRVSNILTFIAVELQ